MCDSGLPFFRQMIQIVLLLDDDVDDLVLDAASSLRPNSRRRFESLW